MAQIKFKNIDKFNKNLKKTLKKAIKDKRMLNEIAETAQTHVIASARLGKDPEKNGAISKPSKKWLNKRQKLVETGKVTPDENYKKNKGLVFSGQFVNSIKSSINYAKSKISIAPTGNHKPYTEGGKSISNKQLYGYLKDTYKVFGLNERRKRALTNILKRSLRRTLK